MDYNFSLLGSSILFFAMISYWFSLFFIENKFFRFLNKFLVIISNLFFCLMLLLRWINNHYFPLSNLYESLIFLSWSILSIQLLLEYRLKSSILGAILIPMVFLLSSFATLELPIDMQKSIPLVPSLQSNWLMMHVSMMMISYATLIIGSLLCIFFIILNTLIFSNSTKQNILELLDGWSYRIIGLGFAFLTLGILSGAIWANEAWGSYWSWDPKETWALITWLVFASYLHARLIKNWKGNNVAKIGSLGFFVIWICYLGVNFLAKGLHSYGWFLN